MANYFSSWLSKNLFFALAYFVGGYVGFSLATSSSSASPVWPAAGIALVGSYLYGKKVAPGILVGALLIQFYSLLDASSLEKIQVSLLLGVIVSLTAYAQGILGAWLIKQKVAPEDPLLDDSKIAWFLFLGGPVSCVLAATVSTSALFLVGTITRQDYLLTWTTWWIGDTIGVLVFAPLSLIFIAAPRALWRKRISTVAVPLGLVLMLVSILFAYGNRQERIRIAAEFEHQVSLADNAITESVEVFLKINQSLKSLFNSFASISKREFLSFTQPLVEGHDFIRALEWIPHVSDVDRKTYEAFSEASGDAQILIRELGPDRQMVSAKRRTEYFPVTYLQPYSGNERALGFDVSSNPKALDALQRARDTGQSTVTEPIQLVQDLTPKIGAVVYTPIYQNGTLPTTVQARRESIKGFIAGVFYVGDQIAESLAQIRGIQLQLEVHDEPLPIYSDIPEQSPHTAIPLGLHQSGQIQVLNRTWTLNYAPSTDFIHQQRSWNGWWFMLGGFAFTSLTGIALLMLTGRTLKTEDLVKIRTTELETEVAERRLIISEREGHNQILQAIIESKPLEQILQLIIETAQSICPPMRCAILLLDEKQLQLGAAPSLPATYHDTVKSLALGVDAGFFGAAAAGGQRVIIENIHTHFSSSEASDMAQALGITTCWSEPILSPSGKIIGTFDIYYATPQKLDEPRLELIEDFVKLASLAIEKKQTEEQIVQLALYDALTGLPNRRLFLDRLQQEISTAHGRNACSVILFLDLDNFKTLNDSLGHRIGDELLIQVAQRLQECCRPEDMAARLGGDEFVVMLSGTSGAHTDKERISGFALRVAHRIQASINEAYLLDRYEHHVSCSIGITLFPQHSISPEEILQQADTAMYSSKTNGRNSVCFYHSDMQRRADRRLELEKGLKQALHEKQFLLYYQPQYASKAQHHLVSAEVLLRWQHPAKGIIPPAEFIALAEDTGLIVPIGQWVLQETCKRLNDWPELDYLAVNISPRQFRDPQFAQRVQDTITRHHVLGHRLMFEVTEHSLIEDFDDSLRKIKSLKRLGIGISIDDFGTGYSSLSYLRNLPVDQLKIDQKFIGDILQNANDAVIVDTIITLAQHMGLDIVAEGIEFVQQIEFLKTRNCHKLQGYYFSKPMPAERFAALLKQSSTAYQTKEKVLRLMA